MDSYSVHFSSVDLDIKKREQNLSKLMDVSRRERGSVKFWQDGKIKKSVRGVPFPTSSLSLDYDGTALTNFLEYLCASLSDKDYYGIEEIENFCIDGT